MQKTLKIYEHSKNLEVRFGESLVPALLFTYAGSKIRVLVGSKLYIWAEKSLERLEETEPRCLEMVLKCMGCSESQSRIELNWAVHVGLRMIFSGVRWGSLNRNRHALEALGE